MQVLENEELEMATTILFNGPEDDEDDFDGDDFELEELDGIGTLDDFEDDDF